MASLITSNRDIETAIPRIDPLPRDSAEWPDSARSSCRSVLAELESWCRAHDASRMFNSWVAEEAIRQSW